MRQIVVLRILSFQDVIQIETELMVYRYREIYGVVNLKNKFGVIF